MAFSKTIQMYIFDGNPNGRIMCELSNWNGRIYKVSRNELSVFSQRADAENTGVYFLLGKDENNTDTVYIGEAEKVCTRLKQHLHDADYWSDAIVVMRFAVFNFADICVCVGVALWVLVIFLGELHSGDAKEP